MVSQVDRKKMLLEMKQDILERLQNAQSDLEAIERLLVVHDDMVPRPQGASVEEVRQAAIEVLTERGRPVHREQLLELLEERGITVRGKVPVNTLGALMSRFSKDFTPYGQGLWGLREKPIGVFSLEPNGHVVPRVLEPSEQL